MATVDTTATSEQTADLEPIRLSISSRHSWTGSDDGPPALVINTSVPIVEPSLTTPDQQPLKKMVRKKAKKALSTSNLLKSQPNGLLPHTANESTATSSALSPVSASSDSASPPAKKKISKKVSSNHLGDQNEAETKKKTKKTSSSENLESSSDPKKKVEMRKSLSLEQEGSPLLESPMTPTDNALLSPQSADFSRKSSVKKSSSASAIATLSDDITIKKKSKAAEQEELEQDDLRSPKNTPTEADRFNPHEIPVGAPVKVRTRRRAVSHSIHPNPSLLKSLNGSHISSEVEQETSEKKVEKTKKKKQKEPSDLEVPSDATVTINVTPNSEEPPRKSTDTEYQADDNKEVVEDVMIKIPRHRLTYAVTHNSRTLSALISPKRPSPHSPEMSPPVSPTSFSVPFDTLSSSHQEDDPVLFKRPSKGRPRTVSNSRIDQAQLNEDMKEVYRSSYCIPHRFSPVSILTAASLKYTNAGQAVCPGCQQQLKSAVVKCAECQMLAHRSCSLLLPPTCGMPNELLKMHQAQEKLSPQASSFGVSLEVQCAREGDLIPGLVRTCIKNIEKRGLDVEGIYRLSGSGVVMDRLKMQFQYGRPNLEDAEWSDISVVTGVLKQYFRSLPDPLLQVALYDDFIQSIEERNEEVRFIRMQETIDKLSPAHQNTLAFTIRHLARVQSCSELNKMTITNLSLIFGPTLMRSNNLSRDILDMGTQAKVMAYLISHSRDLFGADLMQRDMSLNNSINLLSKETAV